MSLYNQLFGRNKLVPVLLPMLGLHESDLGRFRDATVNKAGDTISILTRCGGDNREEYQWVFDHVKTHPLYIRDYDDSFDCTYATIEFKVPPEFADEMKMIGEKLGIEEGPLNQFSKLIEDLQAGKDTEETRKAMEVGNKLISEIQKGLDKEGPNINKI